MSENAYTRVAQAVIRLIAFALIVISLLLYVLDHTYLYTSTGPDAPPYSPPPPRPVRLVLEAIAFLIGLILFFTSRPLAEHFTKDLD